MFDRLSLYDSGTITLYTIIVFLSAVFAFFSQKYIGVSYENEKAFIVEKKNVLFYFLSFAIAAFFCCFAGVGTDRVSYIRIFEQRSFLNDDIEIGFSVLMNILGVVIKDGKIFLSFISFLTLAFEYIGVWKCRKYINPGISIAIYLGLYYLQSFDLIRMYFALSILVLGAWTLFEKKYYGYYIYIVFAMSIHYSIIFVFLAYSFALLLSNQKVFNNRRAFWLLAIGSIVVLISGVTLFQKIAALNFFFVSRYTSYVELASSPGGLGYKWIFNLVPYFLILGLHRSTYEKNEDHTIYIISIVYMFVSAILALMNYSIPGLERARTTLNMPIIIILSYMIERNFILNRTIYKQKNFSFEIANKHIIIRRFTMYFLIFTYLIISLFMYMNGYLRSDGLDFYKFIWQM